jgi:mycothiol synthase
MRPATLDDVEGAVAMFNAYSRQIIGIDEFDGKNYRREWEAPGLNLENDIRVVCAPDGQIVGCMEVWDLFDPHVRVNTWGRVHPDHQGRGIGSALVAWAESRARQAIAKAPKGTRVSVSNGVLARDTAAQELLRNAGFSLARHFWRMEIEMSALPPAPVWPDGLTLRTMIPGQDERAVVQAVRDSFRDHWGFVERPFEDDLKMWTHFMQDEKFDPSLWFVAMDGDQIAGFSLCWSQADDDPNMGWVGTLGVLRPWRRHGLGLALLQHSFGEFYRRGKRKAGLGVDATSLTGATRLYERAGMHVAREFCTYEKNLRPGVDLSTTSVGA